MTHDLILSASILSADFSDLRGQIQQAEAAGIDWIHVDVMDGHFVPNITMGPFIVDACRKITRLPIDVHLMIEKPERYIESYYRAGASRLSVHVEGNPHVFRTLEEIRTLGANPGIVLNPGTPASAIAALLPIIDHVLVMTVNPGFSGQVFIPSTLEKIREIREMLDQGNRDAQIQVDGGISEENIRSVYEAGARIIVTATSVFKNPLGIAAGVKGLRSAVK